jgi:serine/threonine protein kinase
MAVHFASPVRRARALAPEFRFDLPPAEDPIRQVLDRRVPWAIHDETFSLQAMGTGPWPDQGWKLHVSATPPAAAAVLEAALDVLLPEGARFKVVTSLKRLFELNNGFMGVPQIGKFITVYPADDAQAVRLAVRLDEATRQFRGPRVPTDRPLRPESLVHYRYGALKSRAAAEGGSSEGNGAFDLLDPAGRLTNDVRLPFYLPPPPEILDPFAAAGVFVPRPEREALLCGRYLVSDALSSTPRGGVYRAADFVARPARICLLKEAWHDVALDGHGRDARDWAANEARILSRHDGDPGLPRLYDHFEVDGNSYVAIEFIEGTPLDQVLVEGHRLESGLHHAQVIEIGLATADALAHLHEIGLVFRDFKAGNVIRTPDGGYRLIDFGVAYAYREDTSPALSMGTPPFYPREPFAGEPPSPADDIFSWGAVLYHLAGGDASFVDRPQGEDYLRPFPRRPLTQFRPDFPAALAAVIDRAVAWERADRFATMREAQSALAEAAKRIDGSASSAGKSPARGAEESARTSVSTPSVGPSEALRLARDVGDAVCAAAEERNGGLCWKSRSEVDDHSGYNPDLYSGAAGIGLFLAELAHETGDDRYADAARGAARWLGGPVWGRGRAQHGLHYGESGVAYSFLRLAELLDAPGYVTAAELRMRRLRGTSPATVDLIYGSAGSLLALLHLHAATGAAEYLADARAAGDDLVRTARAAPQGDGCYWEVAPAAPGAPVFPYLGLLHGAAGMGLALARLAQRTGDEKYLRPAVGAAELLLGAAVPSQVHLACAKTEVEALAWPRLLGDRAVGLQAHCHGAGGIAQFFIQLDQLVRAPRYRDAAKRAAYAMAAQLEHESRSCICHGLSGTGHLMLDCYQAWGDPQWLALAHECVGQLERFRSPEQPRGVYLMHEAKHGDGRVSPDLMLGYAGAGSFFLRLVNAERAPDPILR